MRHPSYGELSVIVWVFIIVCLALSGIFMLGILIGKMFKAGSGPLVETCLDRDFACCDGEIPAPANCLLYGSRSFMDAA